jgi:signal transduction histidine kinase
MAVLNRQRNLVYANSAFTDFTGVPEKELIGGRACGVFGCINSFDNPDGCGFGTECKSCGLLRAIEDSFETGRTNKDIEYHTTLLTKSGRKDVWLLGATAPILFADKQLLLLNFIDISERRKAEAEILQKNAALSELNATRDRFFSIIAHDLRSPFSGILGFSELLLEQIQAKDYTGIEQYASNILKSSRRMMDLLTNLLEWARSQTGMIKFEPVDIEMVNFIEEIVSMFNEISSKKSVTILTETPRTLHVSADAHMIGSVIRNLISNAVKFSTRGGKIVVRAGADASEILISVKDSGIGISESRLNSLFRPETNNATPGTDNEMGTGLGLILCKEFVEKHGGRIWAESPEGEGAIFSFTLPLGRS